jgi:RNA polymerase sigma factor (sigma-70 family)
LILGGSKRLRAVVTWLGVDDGFEAWYRDEHRRVLSACAALSGDADAACEATDEAFARAMLRWAAVSAMQSPGAWVQTVALNCLRRSLRRRRADRLLRRRPTAIVDAPAVNPELWVAVRTLPKRQRVAVVLRYVADLTEPQIGEVMGISRGTVAATLSAARKRLARTLNDQEAPTPEEAELIDLSEAGRHERDQPIAEPTPIGVLERRATRIRRRRRMTVAVPLIIAVVTAVAVVRATTNSSQNVVVRPSGLSAPPARSPGHPYLWLSATEVPTSGANLVAAIVNPSAAKLLYGVGGVFQRWTGTTWASAGYWSVSLPDWGGFGGITTKSRAVVRIGLGVGPHSAGEAAEYFTVPSLSAGWYRVGYPATPSRAAAFGVFEVSATAARPAPIDNPVGARLTAAPTLMSSGRREIQIVTSPAMPGTSKELVVRRFDHSLAATIDLQRWDRDHWEQLGTLRVHPPSTAPTQAGAAAVTIPALSRGTYRLVRHSRSSGDLARVFWVTRPILAPTAPKAKTPSKVTTSQTAASSITRGKLTVTVTVNETRVPADTVLHGTFTVDNRGPTWRIPASICSGQIYQVSLVGPRRGPGGVPLNLCPGLFTIHHGINHYPVQIGAGRSGTWSARLYLEIASLEHRLPIPPAIAVIVTPTRAAST